MSLVTILTPTYNRENELAILYNSLQNQSSKNFEWLIVDDGSIDDTELKVKEFQKEANFIIRFIKKRGKAHCS